MGLCPCSYEADGQPSPCQSVLGSPASMFSLSLLLHVGHTHLGLGRGLSAKASPPSPALPSLPCPPLPCGRGWVPEAQLVGIHPDKLQLPLTL